MTNDHTKKTSLSRRNFAIKSLVGGAFAQGSLAMQSLATGLPVAFLSSLANPTQAAALDYKFLIISHLSDGDPLNNNMPGTYAEGNNDPRSAIQHPDVEGFKKPTTFTLGSQSVKAAEPWSKLKGDLRSRMGFWHHGTYVNGHPDFASVMRFNGAVKGEAENSTLKEEFDALIAQETHKGLGTIIAEPVSVGGNKISQKGKAIPILKPSSIKTLFDGSSSGLDNMFRLRDNYVDRAYAQVKNNGTPAQKVFLERMLLSREAAKNVGTNLGDLIDGINGDDANNQAKMIVALMQINLAPVYTMGIPFGGDNHSDDKLSQEVSETISGVNSLNTLWSELKAANLQDRAIFTSLNTFGRTFLRNRAGGRDHNGMHHGMCVFGSGIKAGVIGGVEPHREGGKIVEYKATAINAATGKSSNTDIPFEKTLVSVGKTLAKAVGIDNATLNKRLDGGKIIRAALE